MRLLRAAFGSAAVAVVVTSIAACGGGSEPAATPTPPASTGAGTSLSENEGPPPWPAPSDPLARAVAAGLVPEIREQLTYHVHSHLDVFVDGTPVVVPAGIGIAIDDPGVKTFDTDEGPAYGGIEGCDQPCISPLHTHDATGILHTESATPDPNTLGQFFVEWGVRLDDSCVGGFCRPDTPIAIYVDGEAYDGDPREIGLADFREIAIVIGTPPAEIPSKADFSNA